jgi:hypothetical protein
MLHGLQEWGAVMKLARRASMLCTEDQRRSGRIKEPEQSSILLYTDDPTTAAFFATESDMHHICKASSIEGVCIIMGENFPPLSFEAKRDDLELPRVAAMWYPPPGEKCPRCRIYNRPIGDETCKKCTSTLRAKDEGHE